jgi:hypothetical protein
MPRRGRPTLDDWPLVRAVVALLGAGVDCDQVYRDAAARLDAQRKLSRGRARRRVHERVGEFLHPQTPEARAAVFEEALEYLINDQPAPPRVDHEFIAELIQQQYGQAAADRLSEGRGAAGLCARLQRAPVGGTSCLDLLAAMIKAAIDPGPV